MYETIYGSHSLGGYLVVLALFTYAVEFPLIVLLTRKAGHTSIDKLGVPASERQEVEEGLVQAGQSIRIDECMAYVDFVVAGLVVDLAKLDNKEKE